MTLTKFMVGGRRGQSSHALVDQGDARYNDRRRELNEKYYPMEVDPAIPFAEKFQLMDEWWSACHAVLLEGGLTRAAIARSVAGGNIAFRDDCVALFEALAAWDVPLLIFSAGLADVIEEVVRQKLHRSFPNIRVVSNRMVFDDAGNLTTFRGRIIHVLNKNEHALELAAPLPGEEGDSCADGTGTHIDDTGTAIVKGRTNVLLLGDHLGDLGMSNGVQYENRITVGFLNDNVNKWFDTYVASFDIVILDDGPMTTVNELLADVFRIAS
eukprot:SM000190S04844  [mRNA]  locus=s190:18813:21477:+ [translate_table: standard]